MLKYLQVNKKAGLNMKPALNCQIYFFYIKKLSNIPAPTADPITPETFGAMACISRWFVGSSFTPIFCTTLALSGTADTPEAPIIGFTGL